MNSSLLISHDPSSFDYVFEVSNDVNEWRELETTVEIETLDEASYSLILSAEVQVEEVNSIFARLASRLVDN